MLLNLVTPTEDSMKGSFHLLNQMEHENYHNTAETTEFYLINTVYKSFISKLLYMIITEYVQ